MAHSSILAWEIPWTEDPGGLQSVGSQRVRQDLATKQQQKRVEYTLKLVGLREKHRKFRLGCKRPWNH